MGAPGGPGQGLSGGCRVCASGAPCQSARGARAQLPGLAGGGSGHVSPVQGNQSTLLTDSRHGQQACASPRRNTRHFRSRLSGGAGAPARARPCAPAAARRRARPACRSATSAPLPPGPRPRPPACARARAVRVRLGFELILGSTNQKPRTAAMRSEASSWEPRALLATAPCCDAADGEHESARRRLHVHACRSGAAHWRHAKHYDVCPA